VAEQRPVGPSSFSAEALVEAVRAQPDPFSSVLQVSLQRAMTQSQQKNENSIHKNVRTLLQWGAFPIVISLNCCVFVCDVSKVAIKNTTAVRSSHDGWPVNEVFIIPKSAQVCSECP
jgi:hypothetical protein